MMNYKIFERVYTIKEDKSYVTTSKQTISYSFLGLPLYKKHIDSIIKVPDDDKDGHIGFKK